MEKKIHLDKITIEELTVPCIIGIADKERTAKQPVTVNISMFADLSGACLTDDINDTVNYKTIKNRVKDLMAESSYFLIEKLADQIARICFDDPVVEELTVKVAKPSALTLARSVSVTLYRKRQDYER